MSENGQKGEQPIDESILIIQAKEGDKNAFDELFNIYKPKLMAYAMTKTQNQAEAEELVQETFTKFWEALPEYETTGSPKNFLYTILIRKIQDKWRKISVGRKYDPKIKESYTDRMQGQATTSPESHIINQKKLEAVQTKIDTLDETDQNIFRLYFIEGLTYDEIAIKLKIKPSTVNGRIFRLRKMFQKLGEKIDNKD